MNEKIRELAEQSGLKVESWMTNPPKPFQILGSAEEFEKFAELIILECVNVVMDGTKEGDHYAQCIERHFDNGNGGTLHFGIEE